MKQFLKNLATDDSGQDLIEYALIAAMVALGTQAVIKGTDTDIMKVFNGIGNQLTSAVA
jgi:pilus assembly protein Flp/PilA